MRQGGHRDTERAFEGLMAAWTAGGAERYGECSTSDCDYVSSDGTRAAGRAPMVESHDELICGVLRGSALVRDVESVRMLGDEVALVHATGSVLMPWRGRLPRRRLSRQTLVAARTPDGWRVTALRRVRPVRVPPADSVPSRASDALARLVGASHVRGTRP